MNIFFVIISSPCFHISLLMGIKIDIHTNKINKNTFCTSGLMWWLSLVTVSQKSIFSVNKMDLPQVSTSFLLLTLKIKVNWSFLRCISHVFFMCLSRYWMRIYNSCLLYFRTDKCDPDWIGLCKTLTSELKVLVPLRSPSCTLPLMLSSMKVGTLSFLSMTHTSTVKLWRCPDARKDTCGTHTHESTEEHSQHAASPWETNDNWKNSWWLKTGS